MKTSESTISRHLSQLRLGRSLSKDDGEWLYAQFDSLCRRSGLLDGQKIIALWVEIALKHNEAHRFYHNLTHLYNLIQLVDRYEVDIFAPDLLRWAVFYHDFVYNVGSTSNESDSAEAAGERLSAFLASEELRLVEKYILATAKHQLPPVDEQFTTAEQADCGLFLDFDLAILAAPAPIYQQYTQAIAQEYTTLYHPTQYREGRRAFLDRFLRTHHTFFLSPTFEPVEEQAMENVLNELSSYQ